MAESGSAPAALKPALKPALKVAQNAAQEKKTVRIVPPAPKSIGILTQGGLVVRKSLLVQKMGYKNVEKLLKTLTIVEKLTAKRKGGHFAKKIYVAYGLEGSGESINLVLPLVIGKILLQARVINQLELKGCSEPCRELPDFELTETMWSYQSAAIDYVCETRFTAENAAKRAAFAYLQLDPGLGKTVVGIGFIKRLRKPTLIEAPTDAIREQWLEELRFWAPELRCAAYDNSMENKKKTAAPGPGTHDVVVIIVNTLRKKEPSFLNGYGFVILDEAHELYSPENSKVLWLCQTQYVLGLSGTPEYQPNGLDQIVPRFFGGVIWQEQIPGFNIDEAKFTGEVWRIDYTGHPDHRESVTSDAGTVSAIMTIGSLIKDPNRLRLIAESVKKIHGLHEKLKPEIAEKMGLGSVPGGNGADGEQRIRRHGIFVFAEHREYLPAIRKSLLEVFSEDEIIAPELAEESKIADSGLDIEPKSKKGKNKAKGVAADPTKKITILRGGVARDEPTKARKSGVHIVLTTYGFSRRGISLPDMTAIILATPRRNGMSQILARARRRGSDQSIRRIVVDIVDVCTKLKSQVKDRETAYKKLEYPVKTIKASYEDYPVAEEANTAVEENDLIAALNDLKGV